MRLFCFPYAGGSAQIYRQWSSFLPKTISVFPTEFPGRGRRFKEKPFSQIEPLVENLYDTLLAELCSAPFAFFGHSLGALVAFELSRFLRKRNQPLPVHLFASSHLAPTISHTIRPIADLPDQEFKEELRSMDGTPQEVLENAELMEMILPFVRADFKVNETYSYVEDKPLDLPITAFGGVADPHVNRESLEAWSQQTSLNFSVKLFSGDHFYLKQHPLELFQAITQTLLSTRPFV